MVVQTKLLDINRSTLYYRPKSEVQKKMERRQKVLEEYLKRPYYGSRKIAKVLTRKEDKPVNRKAVQADMRKLGIQAICPKRNLSRKQHGASIFPYLLKDLEPAHPNQVWAIDITYVRLQRSYVYLVAVIDVFSRFIVGWALSLTMDTGFVLEALQKAFIYGKPQIIASLCFDPPQNYAALVLLYLTF